MLVAVCYSFELICQFHSTSIAAPLALPLTHWGRLSSLGSSDTGRLDELFDHTAMSVIQIDTSVYPFRYLAGQGSAENALSLFSHHSPIVGKINQSAETIGAMPLLGFRRYKDCFNI